MSLQDFNFQSNIMSAYYESIYLYDNDNVKLNFSIFNHKNLTLLIKSFIFPISKSHLAFEFAHNFSIINFKEFNNDFNLLLFNQHSSIEDFQTFENLQTLELTIDNEELAPHERFTIDDIPPLFPTNDEEYDDDSNDYGLYDDDYEREDRHWSDDDTDEDIHNDNLFAIEQAVQAAFHDTANEIILRNKLQNEIIRVFQIAHPQTTITLVEEFIVYCRFCERDIILDNATNSCLTCKFIFPSCTCSSLFCVNVLCLCGFSCCTGRQCTLCLSNQFYVTHFCNVQFNTVTHKFRPCAPILFNNQLVCAASLI